MAEILKQEYNLLALKIAMDLSAENPQVRFALHGPTDGKLILVRDWLRPAEEIGLPPKLNLRESIHVGYRFRFPINVLEDLKGVIAKFQYRNRPLWLHLAKPLGYLNLVPWEQLLVPALRLPILRLPDFLAKPPRESLNSLDVILCSSLPAAKDPFMAVEHLGKIVEGILASGPSRTIIHIFTDLQIHRDLVNRMQSIPQVRVYDPAQAPTLPPVIASTRIREPAGRIESPWLIWMRDSLEGRSVDVVHFLVHGYLARDQGALAFAESPKENLDHQMARFVGASELLMFLTQMGVWSAGFSSPEHNYSEMGLRLLADTIAQIRPGPVLHHEVRMDLECVKIAEAYGFLFGSEDVKPPISPALFIYCHPSRLEQTPTSTSGKRRKKIRGLRDKAIMGDVANIFIKSETKVPAWIASMERYIEQRQLEADRLCRDKELTVSTPIRQKCEKDAALIQATLRQIKETMVRVTASNKARNENG